MLHEWECLVQREIRQVDSVPDVERSARGVLDQIPWRRDADEHERQPLKCRIGGAILVQETDGGKEIVGELEPQGRVDLVDEHDQPLAALLECHLTQIPREPVSERVMGLGVPPLRRRRVQHQLVVDGGKEALVPLLRRGLGAKLREVDDDGLLAFGKETFGGADHQARLAHLPRRQNVREVSRAAVRQQLVVSTAFEIHAPAGLHGPAGDQRERFRTVHGGAHGNTGRTAHNAAPRAYPRAARGRPPGDGG
jgi:hypothetical protein